MLFTLSEAFHWHDYNTYYKVYNRLTGLKALLRRAGSYSERIIELGPLQITERVINKFWKEGVIPKLNTSNEPLVIPQINEIGLGNRIAVSIRKDQEVLGYIWILELEKKLNENDLADLKLAASKAKNQLLTKKYDGNWNDIFTKYSKYGTESSRC